MEYHSRLSVVDEKTKKSQRLRIGLQGGKPLRFIGIRSFIGRQKIDPKSALCCVACDLAAMDGRNRTEGRVDMLQNIKHWRDLVFDCNGNMFELCDVDIARLDGGKRQFGAEHCGIGLVGSRADQNGIEEENPGAG